MRRALACILLTRAASKPAWAYYAPKPGYGISDDELVRAEPAYEFLSHDFDNSDNDFSAPPCFAAFAARTMACGQESCISIFPTSSAP